MQTERIRESEHVSIYRVMVDGTTYHFMITQIPPLPHKDVVIFIRRGFLRRLLHLFLGVHRFDTMQTHTVIHRGLEDAIRLAEREIAKAHRKGLESSTDEGFPGPDRSRNALHPDPQRL